MEQVKSISPADKVIAEIFSETQKYNEAVKNNRPLREAKEIRAKVKALVEELRHLLGENQT